MGMTEKDLMPAMVELQLVMERQRRQGLDESETLIERSTHLWRLEEVLEQLPPGGLSAPTYASLSELLQQIVQNMRLGVYLRRSLSASYVLATQHHSQHFPGLSDALVQQFSHARSTLASKLTALAVLQGIARARGARFGGVVAPLLAAVVKQAGKIGPGDHALRVELLRTVLVLSEVPELLTAADATLLKTKVLRVFQASRGSPPASVRELLLSVTVALSAIAPDPAPDSGERLLQQLSDSLADPERRVQAAAARALADAFGALHMTPRAAYQWFSSRLAPKVRGKARAAAYAVDSFARVVRARPPRALRAELDDVVSASLAFDGYAFRAILLSFHGDLLDEAALQALLRTLLERMKDSAEADRTLAVLLLAARQVLRWLDEAVRPVAEDVEAAVWATLARRPPSSMAAAAALRLLRALARILPEKLASLVARPLKAIEERAGEKPFAAALAAAALLPLAARAPRGVPSSLMDRAKKAFCAGCNEPNVCWALAASLGASLRAPWPEDLKSTVKMLLSQPAGLAACLAALRILRHASSSGLQPSSSSSSCEEEVLSWVARKVQSLRGEAQVKEKPVVRAELYRLVAELPLAVRGKVAADWLPGLALQEVLQSGAALPEGCADGLLSPEDQNLVADDPPDDGVLALTTERWMAAFDPSASVLGWRNASLRSCTFSALLDEDSLDDEDFSSNPKNSTQIKAVKNNSSLSSVSANGSSGPYDGRMRFRPGNPASQAVQAAIEYLGSMQRVVKEAVRLQWLQALQPSPQAASTPDEAKVVCLLRISGSIGGSTSALCAPLAQAFLRTLDDERPAIRRMSGDALGRVVRAASSDERVVEAVLRALSARPPTAGVAYAYGSLLRQVGSMRLGSRSGPMVECMRKATSQNAVWGLHALQMAIDSLGLSFLGQANDALRLLLAHLDAEEYAGAVGVAQAVGKVLNALAGSLGWTLVELRKESAFLALCTHAAREFRRPHYHPVVQLEAVRFLKRVILFAPRSLQVADALPFLRRQFASPLLRMRSEAFVVMRELFLQSEIASLNRDELRLVEAALLRLLDRESDPSLLRDLRRLFAALQSRLFSSEPILSVLLRWVQVFQRDSSTTESSSSSTGLNTKNPSEKKKKKVEVLDEEEEDEDGSTGFLQGNSLGGGAMETLEFQLRHSGSETAAPAGLADEFVPSWRTKCILLGAICDGLEALDTPWDDSGEEAAVQHCAVWVALAYTSCTSDVPSMRGLGARLLSLLLAHLGDRDDPEEPTSGLLAQYQAQLSGALRALLSIDATMPASPPVLCEACELVPRLLSARLTFDARTVSRTVGLLLLGASSPASLRTPHSLPPMLAYGPLPAASVGLAAVMALAQVCAHLPAQVLLWVRESLAAHKDALLALWADVLLLDLPLARLPPNALLHLRPPPSDRTVFRAPGVVRRTLRAEPALASLVDALAWDPEAAMRPRAEPLLALAAWTRSASAVQGWTLLFRCIPEVPHAKVLGELSRSLHPESGAALWRGLARHKGAAAPAEAEHGVRWLLRSCALGSVDVAMARDVVDAALRAGTPLPVLLDECPAWRLAEALMGEWEDGDAVWAALDACAEAVVRETGWEEELVAVWTYLATRPAGKTGGTRAHFAARMLPRLPPAHPLRWKAHVAALAALADGDRPAARRVFGACFGLLARLVCADKSPGDPFRTLSALAERYAQWFREELEALPDLLRADLQDALRSAHRDALALQDRLQMEQRLSRNQSAASSPFARNSLVGSRRQLQPPKLDLNKFQ